jgi:hypothetical protein
MGLFFVDYVMIYIDAYFEIKYNFLIVSTFRKRFTL